jgi:GNAT superfamily N-acetyltransferase
LLTRLGPFTAKYYGDGVAIIYEWRGDFTTAELNGLHAEAFETRIYDESEWNWLAQVQGHSLGWVTARAADGMLLGFVNVPWDGVVHAWIQDTMVARSARHRGIGRRVVEVAVEEARKAGCDWMHVDFEDDLRPFYFDSCGFKPTNAGLIAL